MPLPVSGPISFNAINVELGVAGTTTASLNQTSYRTLAGVPSGTISLSNFYGKANQFSFTISSNQTNANLRTLAINAGWNQSSKLIATINSGVYISSNSTGTPALTVNGSFPGGVELINNGIIVGMGGAGGRGGAYTAAGTAGGAGGTALSVSSAISVRNNNTIAGGGGGGGGALGSGIFDGESTATSGGGGGGGGRSSAAANSAGGVTPFSSGWGQTSQGNPGTLSAAGTGGQTGGVFAYGGTGGGWGAAGATGSSSRPSGTLVGSNGPYAGGAGGSSVVGNSNITWLAFGTRNGPIS
jgi:hypothetical protein